MSKYWNDRMEAQLIFERKWLLKMCLLFDCNISKVAQAGGIDRTTVYHMMDRLELTRTKILRIISPESFLEKPRSKSEAARRQSQLPPGSDKAIKVGCECPILDNAHGRGAWGSEGKDAIFWTSGNCPVHGFDTLE